MHIFAFDVLCCGPVLVNCLPMQHASGLGLLSWHWDKCIIIPLAVKQHWRIWLNHINPLGTDDTNTNTEPEMLFWWNFHHWLHWKLSFGNFLSASDQNFIKMMGLPSQWWSKANQFPHILWDQMYWTISYLPMPSFVHGGTCRYQRLLWICFSRAVLKNERRYIPTDRWRKNNVIIPSKRRLGVTMALLLRRVSTKISYRINYRIIHMNLC